MDPHKIGSAFSLSENLNKESTHSGSILGETEGTNDGREEGLNMDGM